jgi:MSHA biogenesis protein MshQ
LAATAFSGGTATASALSFAFTNKLTAPQSVTLRATDTDAVSSSGYAEGSMALRSGRLRLSNAFGKASAALQVPVVVEYWGNLSWVPTSDDTCTVIPSASVALSNPRSQTGAVSAATSSATAGALTTGRGVLTLAAPNPAGSSLTLDLSVNLGASTADQSCHASHPSTVGANLPWLRSRNGSCATTWDRDPAARASFGIFSPETRKTIHLREIF